jgi:succinate dehydrogenase flavin-adding protein (antitoxin of CptAB toxin-antitoxin module)
MNYIEEFLNGIWRYVKKPLYCVITEYDNKVFVHIYCIIPIDNKLSHYLDIMISGDRDIYEYLMNMQKYDLIEINKNFYQIVKIKGD